MQVKSVCRICAGMCGTVLELDQNGRILRIAPDKEHALSRGYSCMKGLLAHEAVNSPERILEPLKRAPDGSFQVISLETALDEIADRLKVLIAQDGPQTVAIYTGTQVFFNVAFNAVVRAWLKALRSHCYFTSMTIDQSAKLVAAARIGTWNAGRQHMLDSDVLMLVGANPIVSRSVIGLTNQNATRELKAAKARGMKLIVIDPRRTETARLADIHLQSRPGEDATLLAGMLRLILDNEWEDHEFCASYVAQLDVLRRAVAHFTPEVVEARAGVSCAELERACRLFALESSIGMASTGTGPNMAPRSNLSQHLVECLNIICGRFPRAGEKVRNSGVAAAPRSFRAEVDPPCRTWEQGYKSRAGGYGNLFGEMMTSTIPDEILHPGTGRIRSLFVAGGNLAVSMPDQRKMISALEALDLLVAFDPFLSETARLAHYVLPPRMHYEHSDIYYDPAWEAPLSALPFQQYIPARSAPPARSAVAEDWYFLWGLAKRLNIQLEIGGSALRMQEAPTAEHILSLLLQSSQVGFDELMQHPGGHVFEVPQRIVEPRRPESTTRFQLMPADVEAEMAAVAREDGNARRRSFLLISRRMLEVQNSFGRDISAVRKRRRYNPAYLNPDDLSSLGLTPGQEVQIVSDRDRISARVAPDAGLRRGTISMSHCWGGLPDAAADYDEVGSNTNLLIDLDECRETINAMPRMSAILVDIVASSPGARADRGGY